MYISEKRGFRYNILKYIFISSGVKTMVLKFVRKRNREFLGMDFGKKQGRISTLDDNKAEATATTVFQLQRKSGIQLPIHFELVLCRKAQVSCEVL